MLCYYLKRLRMHRKLWQCESRVFPYTHDVIWVFSLSLASLNVVGLLASNFSRESLICSQGPLCISDIIGVSSVILVFASYNVVDLLVSNFSRESPICSWGPLRISDIIGFSSVVFASYDVIWREVYNISWGDPICSRGSICISAVDCSPCCWPYAWRLEIFLACSIDWYYKNVFKRDIDN